MDKLHSKYSELGFHDLGFELIEGNFRRVH